MGAMKDLLHRKAEGSVCHFELCQEPPAPTMNRTHNHRLCAAHQDTPHPADGECPACNFADHLPL